MNQRKKKPMSDDAAFGITVLLVLGVVGIVILSLYLEYHFR